MRRAIKYLAGGQGAERHHDSAYRANNLVQSVGVYQVYIWLVTQLGGVAPLRLEE